LKSCELSLTLQFNRSPEPRNPPRRARATNLEIQKWVARQHGFVPETAWIEHCRQLFGIIPAQSPEHANPCPPEYQTALRQVLIISGCCRSDVFKARTSK
jgi:hypothetical protein